MGWTTCYTAKHWKWVKGHRIVDRKAECDELYTWQKKDENGRVESSTRVIRSTMHGSVWYGACETVIDRKATVWAGICLTCGKSADGTIWGYKEMDETVHPYYCDCPSTILRLLTPTDNAASNAWRKACDERRATKKVQKALTLPNGVTARYRGGWIISSPEYRAANYYSGVRYGKIDKMNALDRFISAYGSDSQKAEWATQKATQSSAA